MSAFASYLVATSQPRSTTASLVFHVWERSGFRPDRADYLCRQTKLNFTSLERHHKASLSGSPPHFQTTQRWHDTHTRTHIRTDNKSLCIQLSESSPSHPTTLWRSRSQNCDASSRRFIRKKLSLWFSSHANSSSTHPSSLFNLSGQRMQASSLSSMATLVPASYFLIYWRLDYAVSCLSASKRWKGKLGSTCPQKLHKTSRSKIASDGIWSWLMGTKLMWPNLKMRQRNFSLYLPRLLELHERLSV